MAKMIELEPAHWCDPDNIRRMYCWARSRSRGHEYITVRCIVRSGDYFDLGQRVTHKQAAKIMAKVAKAQTAEPPNTPTTGP